MSMRRENGGLVIGDLASKMSMLKIVGENLSEQERASYVQDLYQNTDEEVDFELFLKVSFLPS
jgi:plastin-1